MIGKHRVDNVKYLADRPIREGEEGICPDTEFKDKLGYHLSPGIVKVCKVLEIIEYERKNTALGEGTQKPFRLVDVSRKFLA